jgi:hypothetical protein
MIHYREHEFGPVKPRYRVWSDAWFNDQFEVVDYDEFHKFKALAEKLGITFKHHTD